MVNDRNGLPFKARPGLTAGATNFQRVRDGRSAQMLSYLVDLTNARSIAAGTALSLNIAGNMFLSDPLYDLSGNSQAGIARVHFQDQALSPAGTYVTVLPNAVYQIAFTQLLIENFAQAGKFLYIVYGVDVDIQPGSAGAVQASIINLAQQSVGGVNELVVMERGFTYGAAFGSSALLGTGTNEIGVAPASNTNGIILWDAEIHATNGVSITQTILLAKTSAPATAVDGDVILTNAGALGTVAGGYGYTSRLSRPVFIAIGKGLYFRASGSGSEVTAVRKLLYTLL